MLARLIDEVGPPSFERDPSRPAPEDHYGALVRAIVGQQLSVAAARAIYGRLSELFEDRPPTPQELLDQDPLAEPSRPYRSAACRLLWRWLSNTPA